MAEFESVHAFEVKIEHLCGVILRLDAENWEPRNKALLQIISMLTHIEGEDEDRLHDFITPKLFKTFKEPIKHLISDLRSQQVRDACQLLIKLSEIHPDGMKSFLREAFAFIIEGIKVPNKVMSGYVDECISLLIKNCCFKSSIIYMVNEMRENKAKVVRERCMEYLNDILMNWNLTDSEAEPVADAVRIGLEDASVKCRESARTTYFNIFQMFPKKAVKIKSQVSKPLQQKLNSAEKDMGLESSMLSTRSNDDLNASMSSTVSAGEGVSSSSTPKLKKAASRVQIPKPGSSNNSSSSSSSSNSGSSISGISSSRLQADTRQSAAATAAAASSSSSSQSQVPRLTKRASVNDMHTPNSATNRSLSTDSYSHAKSTLDMRQLVSSNKSGSGSSGGVPLSTSKPSIKLRGGGGGKGSIAAAASTKDMASASIDSSVSNSTPRSPHSLSQQQTIQGVPSAAQEAPAQQQSDLKAAMSRRRSVVKNPFEQMMAAAAPSSDPATVPIPAAVIIPPSHTDTAAEQQPLTSSINRAISAAYESVASSNEVLSNSNSGSHNSSPRHKARSLPSPKRTKSIGTAADGGCTTNVATVAVVATTPPAKVSSTPPTVGIQLNQRVIVSRTNNSSLCGTIRFIGHTMFASGQWVGIELDAPEGKNNGSVMGHYYFSCVPNYGLFAREDCIEPLPSSARSSPHQPSTQSLVASLASVSTAIDDATPEPSVSNTQLVAAPPVAPEAVTQIPLIAAPSPPRMTVAARKLSSTNLRDVIANPDASAAVTAANSTTVPSSVPAMKSEARSTNKLNTSEAADELTGILKLKLSSLMDYLNQQLEIVVDLEKESAALKANPNSSSTSASAIIELRDEVVAITEQEQQLIESFKRRLLEKF